ncbi:serine/arginine repetitive matrix protein 1-like [Mercenaria mercenaria]|uniref:serine/arginine repetitive matrix protein 1-like n=1 Tax=Mercenaria mercenaria TaxID=6596 RepID=UPI00234F1821|nr:serine/arginine repetitive matrix protein 1-like [Mercenaria mercenaria]XP_053382458.1 serine/arginine repetitive matrix protein 1-like [Mercenaria mercenaria]
MAAERRKCLNTLGLREGASEEEIKKAYKKLALQYHPDKNDSDDAKGKFQEIGYAYKYLTDGPSAFGTTNPHDVREEMLRRMFEEMFFAQFRGPFGGFPFFCEESDDDDDYYMYYDSSDDCYCGNCDTKGAHGKGRRSYQNTYPKTSSTPQNFPPPSKKQLRKREKRQRQKERAKERKDQDKKEKKATRNLYTDDVNPEPKQKDSKKQTTPEDNSSSKSEDKSDTGISRPDTPVLNQQPQRPNKKQKKKMESEQRKREKEMEEIAAELKKKQEREMEKQREKERIAAQKKEEEIENEINFSHFFDNGKKSRKARQREKKRQESEGFNTEAAQQRNSCNSSVPTGKTYNLNTNRNRSAEGKSKDKTGGSLNKNHESKMYTRKQLVNGNRFDILDDIDDDITKPISGSSISSNGSQKSSQPHSGQSRPTSGGMQSAGPASNAASFSKPTHSNTNNFKSRTFQNTNNQNNSNSSRNFQRNGGLEASSNASSAKEGDRVGKNVSGVSTDRKETPKVNRSLSDDVKSGFNEFEEGEREFVKDWSVFYSDEEDDIDNLDFGNGAPQFSDNQNGSQYYGYGPKSGQDNFGYGYDNSYHPRADPYQPQGHQRRREFIPRTRGYHGPDFRPYFGGPPGFPPYMRGPPPFAQRGMYPPPPPPHFRGGYQARPPRARNQGYPGPRYGPPMGMPGYGYGQPFDGSVPFGGPFHGRDQNVPDDLKRNINRQGSKPKQFSPKKSFKNDSSNVQNADDKCVTGEARPSVQASTNASASGMRVPSPEFCSQQKNNVPDSHFAKNIFSNIENNQAGSGGSLDSLDDFDLYQTGSASTDSQKLRGTRAETQPSQTSPYSGVDMGLDEFLSKDNLGVPAGMFSDNIKNYYK